MAKAAKKGRNKNCFIIFIHATERFVHYDNEVYVLNVLLIVVVESSSKYQIVFKNLFVYSLRENFYKKINS